MTLKPVQRRRLTLFASFAAYFAMLWVLWPTVWVYPLKMFVVLLHEASHAMAAIASGGTVQRILLDPREGGAAYALGGNSFLMLSSGYLGSLVWGLGLMFVGLRTPARARIATYVLGAFILALSILFVRGGFGFAFGIISALVLLGAARLLPARALSIMLTVLGLTSALYALLDIRSDVLQRPNLQSDAYMLGELTGIPTLVWGGLWVMLGLAACFVFSRHIVRKA